MDDDSGDDSNIVRGQREKSKKRKKNVSKRKSPEIIHEIFHFYEFLGFFIIRTVTRKKEKIAINKREKLI